VSAVATATTTTRTTAPIQTTEIRARDADPLSSGVLFASVCTVDGWQCAVMPYGVTVPGSTSLPAASSSSSWAALAISNGS